MEYPIRLHSHTFQWPSHSCYLKWREIHCGREGLYLFVLKLGDVLHIEIVQRRHRFVWICNMFNVLLHLVCAQSYFCSFHNCLDRNELLLLVRRLVCDVLITSGMTKRNFNYSVPNEHRINYVLQIKQWRWGKGNKYG